MWDPAAKGGSVLLLEGTSTLGQFRSTGDRLSIWHPTGPGLGSASVVVDGQVRGTMDQRAAVSGTARLDITGLGSGAHSVAVVVTRGPRVGIDAIASRAVCTPRCQTSPTAMLPTSRGGSPSAAGPRVGASVGFVATRATATISMDARTVQLVLDGRTLSRSDRRITYRGQTLEISGLPPRPHVLTVLPIDPGGYVDGAAALGRRATVRR